MRAWLAHPERFVNGPPRIQRPPSEVWINPPTDEQKSLVIGMEETKSDRH